MANKVGLEVASGGEGASTDLALEGSFSAMLTVVKPQGSGAAQNSQAYDALVWIAGLLVNLLHQLLKLKCL